MKTMTRRLLTQTIHEFRSDKGIGHASCQSSSWYHDYACFSFAVFRPEEYVEDLIAILRPLCEECGWNWNACTVNAWNSANAIFVTLQKDHVITTGDRTPNMPED